MKLVIEFSLWNMYLMCYLILVFATGFMHFIGHGLEREDKYNIYNWIIGVLIQAPLIAYGMGLT